MPTKYLNNNQQQKNIIAESARNKQKLITHIITALTETTLLTQTVWSTKFLHILLTNN